MRKSNYGITVTTLGFLLFTAACKNGESLPVEVTFTEHVAPVIYNNCTICHRPGGGAHFSLITYADAKKFADAMAFVTKEKLMPPWPADPHYTEFKGQRIITDHDIALLAKWA